MHTQITAHRYSFQLGRLMHCRLLTGGAASLTVAGTIALNWGIANRLQMPDNVVEITGILGYWRIKE
jgi:hypothetical protein